MSFFQNTRRPEGIGGKIMVHMMNAGHSSMAEWGFTHIKIQSEDVCLDIGCGGGANVRKRLIFHKVLSTTVRALNCFRQTLSCRALR